MAVYAIIAHESSCHAKEAFTCSQRELEELLLEWSAELGLSDWGFSLAILRRHEMPVPGQQATVSYQVYLKRAVISMIDPIDYATTNSPHPQDMEATLVHELLHLKFWMWEPDEDSTEHTLLEITVEDLARLLVALKRKARRESGEKGTTGGA